MRVDVRIPGGVDAYAIDLRGEKWVTTHGGADSVDTRPPRSYGRRRTCRHCYERYVTPTMLRTDWRDIASSTRSPRQRPRSASCRPQRSFFSKVGQAPPSLTLTPRLATRIRPRDSSRDRCDKPLDRRHHEVLFRRFPSRACSEPLRAASSEGARGRIFARSELHRNEWVNHATGANDRRGDQGCQDSQLCLGGEPTILSHPPRSVRLPLEQRQSGLGSARRATSRERCSERIRHVGKVDRNVHRAGAV